MVQSDGNGSQVIFGVIAEHRLQGCEGVKRCFDQRGLVGQARGVYMGR
jgi:hypothetical protein